jgi:hypothetical protein
VVPDCSRRQRQRSSNGYYERFKYVTSRDTLGSSEAVKDLQSMLSSGSVSLHGERTRSASTSKLARIRVLCAAAAAVATRMAVTPALGKPAQGRAQGAKTAHDAGALQPLRQRYADPSRMRCGLAPRALGDG